MYKAFEDLLNLGGLTIKDYFGDNINISQRNQYILIPFPIQKPNGEIVLKLYKYSLITGDVELTEIKPTTEILYDLKLYIKENENGQLSDFGSFDNST
jgi:hypothetical protein